jgi:hypothetical protein
MEKLEQDFIIYKQKRELYISEREAEVTYRHCKIFRSIARISLPHFLFEFLVEVASNRMIDIKGLIKVLKHSTFIY